ncbi:MAG: ribbon-helix-helix domain-containing protein [Candidatus Omnitrophota bacterium]
MKTEYLGVRIEKDVKKRLNELSEKNYVPKSFYVTKALEMYLEEIEDYETALGRLRDKKDRITKSENFWKEVKNEL